MKNFFITTVIFLWSAAFLTLQAQDCGAPPAPSVNWSECDKSGVNLFNVNLAGANLSGANVSGAILIYTVLQGANMTGANLTGANMSIANLDNADLSNANLTAVGLFRANLSGANLTGADLTNIDLKNINISGANLTDAILTGVVSGGITGTPYALPTGWALVNGYLVGPGANLSGANLTGANLSGANLSGANLYQTNLNDANLSDANLSGASVVQTFLQGANLTGANLTGANMGGANLDNADLSNADLTGANLLNASLPGANLSGANLSSTELSGTNMSGAILTGAILTGAQVTSSNLAGANLSGANLSGIGIYGNNASLYNSDLTGAILTGADLTNMDLRNINISGADLTGAILTGVRSGGITGTPYALPTGWQLINGYLVGPLTVTFDANGGTTPSPTTITVLYNATYGTLATASRPCYAFNGWFTESIGGTEITSESAVSITSNQTLYAQWTAINYNYTEPIVACGSYEWHGTTYTTSNNTATWTGTNAAGCDSIVTLNLTMINQPSYTTEPIVACGSSEWHGTTYTSSNNTATWTGTNAAGCDSIVTLNLTINQPSYSTEPIVACGSYEWHGSTYTSSNNTATWTGTNATGCDSIVTLNLTVNDCEPPVINCPSSLVINSCNSFLTLGDPTITDNSGSFENLPILNSNLSFDGVNDFVNTMLDVSETAFTVEMWFKTNQTNGGIFMVKDGGGAYDRTVMLTNGNIEARTYYDETIVTSGTNYADNNWHHLAFVLGQGGQKLYVDGILKASGIKSASDFYWQDRIAIGKSFSSPSTYFSGKITEFRIWNAARTQAEIIANMNARINPQAGLAVCYHFNEGDLSGNNIGRTTAHDGSGNGNDGTLLNFDLTGSSSNWFNSVTNDAPATFPFGTTLVNWTAQDLAGNTSTCTQTVTIVNNVSYTTEPIVACGSYEWHGNTYTSSNNTATWTGQNAAGCDSIVTLNLTINPLPTITCPGNITVNNDPGQSGAIVSFANATATGEPMPVVTYSHASGSFFPIGITTVTVTATNSCGAPTCSFTVMVNDIEAPVITCPGDITINTESGVCGATLRAIANATDNAVSFASMNVSLVGDLSFDSFDNATSSYFSPMNLTSLSFVNPGYAHSHSDQLDVFIEVHNPTTNEWTSIFTEHLDGAGVYGGDELFFSNLSIDLPSQFLVDRVRLRSTPGQSYTFHDWFSGCVMNLTYTMPNIVYTPAWESLLNVGTTAINCTATDAAGNSSSCSFNVTVVDSEKPDSVPFSIKDYNFSSSENTSLEDLSVDAVTLFGPNTDDASTSISMPFAFAYGSQSVTALGISSNGALVPNGMNSDYNNGTNGLLNSIFPYWDDLHTGPTGSIKSKVVGNAPNRKLVIEWKDNLYESNYGQPYTLTFQAWLIETSNTIQFVYGENTGVNQSFSGTIGIQGGANDFNEVTASNTNSVSIGNNIISSWPGAGRSYIFTPPSDSYTAAANAGCGAMVNVSAYQFADNCGVDHIDALRSDGLSLNSPYPVGVTTVSWTATDFGGNVSDPNVQTVTVTGVSSAASPAAQSICSGDAITNIVLSGGLEGTTFTWTRNGSVSGIPSSGSGNISGSMSTTGATQDVTFTITPNYNGCAGTPFTAVVTVNAKPQPVISGALEFCAGSSTTLDAGAGYSSYLWSTGASTQTISVSSTTPVSVTVTNAAGCSATSASVTPTANAVSTAPTSITSSVAFATAGVNFTLSVNGGSLGTGAAWKWYTGSCGGTLIGTGASISVSQIANTTYFVRAEGTCNTTACATITVNSQCGATSITSSAGTTAVCAGSAVTLTPVGALAPGAQWRWDDDCDAVPSTSDASATYTTASTFTVNPTSTTTYYLQSVGGVCGVTACIPVTINVLAKPATPGTISGSASVCPSTSVTYTIAAVAGATSYTWTAPTNATLVSAQGSTSMTVSYASAFTSGTLKVKAINCSGSSSDKSLSITKQTAPAAPASIAGSASVCPSTSVTYTIAAVTNATSYTWVAPANATLASAQGGTSMTINYGSAFVSGTLSVTAVGCGGTSAAKTLSITKLAVPATPGTISGAAAPCKNSTQTYSIAAVTGATSYTWGLPTGVTFVTGSSQTGTSIQVVISSTFTSGTLSVKANNCAGSSANKTLALSGTAAPATPSTITGSTSVTQNSTNNTYSVTAVAGLTYTWSVPAGCTITLGQGTSTIKVTWGTLAGTIRVTSSNACGTSSASTLAVSVKRSQEAEANGGIESARTDAATETVLTATDAMNTLAVYPNPTTGEARITFSAAAAGKYSLSIVDLQGRVITSTSGAAIEGNNTLDINLSNCSNGVYMIHLMHNDTLQTLRVVKM